MNDKKIFIVKVKGESMLPCIKDGEILPVVTRCHKIESNDIVLFNKMGKTVIHRILAKTNFNGENYFITKGDNNLFIDMFIPINEKEILGKVIFLNSEEYITNFKFWSKIARGYLKLFFFSVNIWNLFRKFIKKGERR